MGAKNTGLCPTCLTNPATTAVSGRPSCVPCITLRKEEREALSSARGKKAKTSVLAAMYPGRNADKHKVDVRETYMRACPKCHARFLSTIDRHEAACRFCGTASPFATPRGLGEPNFQEMEAVSENGLVRCVLGWIGEGKDGDYRPDDPEDEPYLRFDLYVRATPKGRVWEAPEDTSYCTALTAFSDERTCREAISRILSETAEPLSEGHRVKRVCESLSWMDETWFPPPPAEPDPEDDL